MQIPRWLIGLVFLGFLISACAQASALNPPDNEQTEITPFATDPTEPTPLPNEPTQTEPESKTETGTQETVQESPTPTSIHVSSEDCEDPFEGVNRNFSIRGWLTDFCKHSVPYSEIISGGPPRDGIPPIDEPKFVSVEVADEWLEEVEPVISLSLGDDTRAYPLQIMTWHEIVNDLVNGQPVVVTFCPLCNTALTFKRPTIGGEVLTFGTSGNLRNSDLVMWDRQTESWWQQFSGEAIVGDLVGTQLEFIDSPIVSWGDFKSKHPDGSVLSRETGFRRDYGRNPYTGYDNINSSPFLFFGDTDDTLPPMARVLGILSEDGEALAYSFNRLEEELVINDTFAGKPIVSFWKAGTASALDDSTIAEGKDVGSTGVFLRAVEGQTLTFTANGDGTFSDQETNSTWDIFGQAIDGELEGTSLNAISHHDTFWFAWAAFASPESLDR
jgi:hypothetical protein